MAFSKLRCSIKRNEGARVAGENVLRAWNPVRAFTMDEMANYVVRRPGAFALCRLDPGLRQALEHCLQTFWRSFENRHRLVQLEFTLFHLAPKVRTPPAC